MIGGFILPLRAVFYGLMRSEPFCERVLVLGASPVGQRLVEEIRSQAHLGYDFVCVADDPPATARPTHCWVRSRTSTRSSRRRDPIGSSSP